MRILQVTVWILFVLISSHSWGQSRGFYGKNKFAEFSLTGCIPVFSNLKDFYVKSGDGVVEGNDFVNGGFNGLVGIAINPTFALSLSTSMWYSNANGPGVLYYFHEGSNDESSVLVDHENLDIRTLSFMPIIEFTGKSGLLPMGISHSIGIGFNRSWVKEKSYAYESDNDFYSNGNKVDFHEFMDSVVAVNGPYIDYRERYKDKTLMYALKIRTPISKKMMITYGFRYTLNAERLLDVFGVSYSTITSYETALKQQITTSIKATRVRSIVSLQLGLTYVF